MQEETNNRNYDGVSMHITDTNTAEEGEERTQEEEPIVGGLENMTIQELRQRWTEER